MSKLEWDLSDLFTTNEQFYKSILKVQKLLDKILKYNITDAKSLLVLLEKYSSLKVRLNQRKALHSPYK